MVWASAKEEKTGKLGEGQAAGRLLKQEQQELHWPEQALAEGTEVGVELNAHLAVMVLSLTGGKSGLDAEPRVAWVAILVADSAEVNAVGNSAWKELTGHDLLLVQKAEEPETERLGCWDPGKRHRKS